MAKNFFLPPLDPSLGAPVKVVSTKKKEVRKMDRKMTSGSFFSRIKKTCRRAFRSTLPSKISRKSFRGRRSKR